MRIAIVGLGSMGKRRVRNLKALGVSDLVGMDLRDDRRTEATEKYGITTVATLEAALASSPQAVIISTPPDLHMPVALEVVRRGLPFFTEAGVPDLRMRALIGELALRSVVGVPSCTMRYFPGPRTVTRLLRDGAVGNPLVWTYHSGQYLPDWHPWEDIASFYVGKRATGGCREIVAFELTWLVDALGPISEVLGAKGKVSTLPVDIDDVYQLTTTHASGARGQLTVDVLARTPVRFFRAIGDAGTIEWDASTKTVRTFSVASRAWTTAALEVGTVEKGYVNPEEPYIDEMRDFLAAARGEAAPAYTYEEDWVVQSVLLAAEGTTELAQCQ